MTAKALILAGYGLNSEEELHHAFEYVGLSAEIIHINDLIENPNELENTQILAIPGGFSYGDDTGAGNAYAQLGLADAILTDNAAGSIGTATTAARSDHRHAQSRGAALPAVDGTGGIRHVLVGHASLPDVNALIAFHNQQISALELAHLRFNRHATIDGTWPPNAATAPTRDPDLIHVGDLLYLPVE